MGAHPLCPTRIDGGPGSYSGLEHLTENRGVEGSNPPQARIINMQGLVPIGRTHALGV